MRLKADLTLFLVAMIWGTGFVAQRIAGQQHIVYLFNGARYLLAALVVFPFAKRKAPIPRGQWKWMLVAGLLLFVASALTASRSGLHNGWKCGFHHQSVCGLDSHYAISFLE